MVEMLGAPAHLAPLLRTSLGTCMSHPPSAPHEGIDQRLYSMLPFAVRKGARRPRPGLTLEVFGQELGRPKLVGTPAPGLVRV